MMDRFAFNDWLNDTILGKIVKYSCYSMWWTLVGCWLTFLIIKLV
jgi:hypothetical protein